MFTKMMIGTDLTPASFSLVNFAIQLKSIGTKEIVLVHVVESSAFGTPLSAEIESVLKQQKEVLEQQQIRVSVEIFHGATAQALDEAAERNDVDGILIGSHGGGGVKLATLGSVSAALLGRTQRPLLLHRVDLGEEAAAGEVPCGSPFSDVLFPTDFSETAERALDYLGKIALEHRGNITLLHVISAEEASAHGESSEEDARYLLEAKKRRLEKLGAAEVKIELVHGEPSQEIVSRAKKELFTLVVMGCQGKGIVRRVLVGSTAEHVARHTDLPLLLIPGVHHVE